MKHRLKVAVGIAIGFSLPAAAQSTDFDTKGTWAGAKALYACDTAVSSLFRSDDVVTVFPKKDGEARFLTRNVKGLERARSLRQYRIHDG